MRFRYLIVSQWFSLFDFDGTGKLIALLDIAGSVELGLDMKLSIDPFLELWKSMDICICRSRRQDQVQKVLKLLWFVLSLVDFAKRHKQIIYDLWSIIKTPIRAKDH